MMSSMSGGPGALWFYKELSMSEKESVFGGGFPFTNVRI